jgi:hypothetical protein
MFFYKFLKNRSDAKKQNKQMKQELREKAKKRVFFMKGLIHYHEFFESKKTYCLYPLVDDCGFFNLSQAVMQELIEPFAAVNSVSSYANFANRGNNENKKHAPVVMHFIKTYDSSMKHSIQSPPTFKDERDWELLSLSDGMDMDLFQSSVENCPHAAVIGIYGFSEYAHKSLSFEAIKETIKNEDFDIAVFYNRNYPELPIYINPDRIDVNDVMAKISAVCNRFGKTMELDL